MQRKLNSLSDLDEARHESSQKHSAFVSMLASLRNLISESAMNELLNAYIDSRKSSYDLGIATAVLGEAEAEWERARGLISTPPRSGNTRWGGRQRKVKEPK